MENNKKIKIENFFMNNGRSLTEINFSIIFKISEDDYEKFIVNFFQYGLGVVGRICWNHDHFLMDDTGFDTYEFRIKDEFDNIEEANDYLEKLVEDLNKDINDGMIIYDSKCSWDWAPDIFHYLCKVIIKKLN